MLNIRQLQLFCAVMETGSVSEAARVIHVSQPAISKSLRLLEEHLGFPLFYRVGVRLNPSIEAQRLYRNATRIFDELSETTDLVRQLRLGDEGKLTIGAAYTLAITLIPEAIRAFHEKKSRIDLQFVSTAPKDVVELVLGHKVDLGFAYEPVKAVTLEQIPICDAEIVCLLPQGHSLERRSHIDADDLHGEKIISYAPGSHAANQLRQNCTHAGVSWAPAIAVNQTQAALSLVRAGVGVAVVDPFALLGGHRSDIAIKPFRPRTLLECHAIYANDRPISQIFIDFVEALLAIVINHRDELPTGVMSITSRLTTSD